MTENNDEIDNQLGSKLGSTSRVNVGMLLSLSVLVIILDQLTKYFSETQLDANIPLTIFPGFDLWLAHNYGAAFSFLNDAGGWQRWFFTLSSTIVSAIILVWLIKLPKSKSFLALALALILGGAIGNLIDRVLFGYVIDFISVYYHQYRFATFNIADSAISIGAVMLVIDMIFGDNDAELVS